MSLALWSLVCRITFTQRGNNRQVAFFTRRTIHLARGTQARPARAGWPRRATEARREGAASVNYADRGIDAGNNAALPVDVGDLDWDGSTSETLHSDEWGKDLSF